VFFKHQSPGLPPEEAGGRSCGALRAPSLAPLASLPCVASRTASLREAGSARSVAQVALACGFTLLLLAAPVLVAEAAPAAADSGEVARAREEFVRGADFANRAQWAEALVAFEHSAKLRPHPTTTFNIGACQRAMGSYTLARQTLVRALSDHESGAGGELPQMLVNDAHGYLAEIDRLLATVTVTLLPADAQIAVDGRPLESASTLGLGSGTAALPVLVAGVSAPGRGQPPPVSQFRVIVNPGTRVFTLSRKGFADAVISRTFGPGATADLNLELDRLPAAIHVGSSPPGGIVTLNGIDVGATPVDVARPTGSYRVVIRKPGFVTYDTRVLARPGEGVSLDPSLPVEKTPITQRWWFWTGLGVVVAGAAAGTYFYVRGQEPAPAATPPTGGTMGWTVQLH
jgi:hypothetical protein